MTSIKDWLAKTQLISEKCQPFLELTQRPLLRGISKFPRIIQIAQVEQVRKDRKPRDTKRFVHDVMDDWFFTNMKIAPRSQGLFCTGSYAAAKTYSILGNICCVFPVGQFKYVYGVKQDRYLRDTYEIAQEISHRVGILTRDEVLEEADRIMSEVEWRTTDLDTALKYKSEIVLLCDEVILVPIKLLPRIKELPLEQSYALFLEKLTK